MIRPRSAAAARWQNNYKNSTNKIIRRKHKEINRLKRIKIKTEKHEN